MFRTHHHCFNLEYPYLEIISIEILNSLWEQTIMTSQPVFNGYAEAFKEERSECNIKEGITNFFTSDTFKERLGLESITSMLSVGPGELNSFYKYQLCQ